MEMTELEKLRFENLRLVSMCRVAGWMIRSKYDHFCDEEGYGPANLCSRLEGRIPPDFYMQQMDTEEIEEYLELEKKWRVCGHRYEKEPNQTGQEPPTEDKGEQP